MRIQQQAGYILHSRNYSETSLILEAFTSRHGRIGLLAKGARRPSSRLRSLLNPFQPLLLSWTGRGELPILTAAEARGCSAPLAGAALYCGFYLNELLVRLLHRDDPHELLFDGYGVAIDALATTQNSEAILRMFEVRLLGEIGYGLVLNRDVGDGSPIEDGVWYDYVPDRGPLRFTDTERHRAQGIVIRGASLLALAKGELTDPQALREAKRLMRVVLARYLGDKPLHSRKLFHGLAARSAEESAAESLDTAC